MLQSFEDKFVGEMSPQERSVLRHGGAWFFLILLSYYILRPIREQISTAYGIQNLSWLFSATFVAMLIAIPLYSVLVGRFHRKRLVPCIYAFFIANLGLFWVAMRFAPDAWQIWIARVLFIWISVFGLFIVSFFWSVVGDMLSTEQGRRIFGIIAGGGTIGGMLGSQVAARLVSKIGVANLMLIPFVSLAFGLLVYVSLERSYSRLADDQVKLRSGKATGGNPFAGFTAVVRSKYLLAICFYGFFLATCGTTIYFQQSEIVKAAFESLPGSQAQEASTEYFANVNFYVSIVTLVMQFFVVGWLMRTVGLGWTLAVLPSAYILGIGALALSPEIAVLAVITVTGRSAEYGIANPAREVLFTAVNREERYKAKSFIDTVVRRGGDTMVGSLYRGLRESAGFAMTTLSWLVIPVAVVWTGLAIYIGRENARVVRSTVPIQSDSERHDQNAS
ncbi:MAG: NTP/NDP exchange transporter [Rubripirellula sp.]